jgi:biotin operon repressor
MTGSPVRDALIVDRETGELIPAISYLKRRWDVPHYVCWVQEDLLATALDNSLRGESLRVFLFLLSVLEPESYIRVNQSEVARKLKMTRQSVNRAFQQLREEGYIEDGPNRTYRAAFEKVWKGTHKNWNLALDQRARRKTI